MTAELEGFLDILGHHQDGQAVFAPQISGQAMPIEADAGIAALDARRKRSNFGRACEKTRRVASICGASRPHRILAEVHGRSKGL